MCSDQQKNNPVVLLPEDCPIIAGDIDTATTGKNPINRVIIKKRVERLVDKKIFPFNKPDSDFFRQFFEILKKLPVKLYFHNQSLK